MKSLVQTVKDIERDLVINLAVSTRHQRITFDESKKIARDFMTNYPFKNYEDLFEKLYVLSNTHREVRKVYVKYSPDYYEEKTQIKLRNLRDFLRINYGKN